MTGLLIANLIVSSLVLLLMLGIVAVAAVAARRNKAAAQQAAQNLVTQLGELKRRADEQNRTAGAST